MPRSIYNASDGNKSIYKNRKTSCPVIDETAAIEALEALLLTFEDIIKHYPPGTFIGKALGSLEVGSSVNHVLFARLKWVSTYKTQFTGSKEQCYDLLHIYISSDVDWHIDRMLVKLVAAHGITVS
jgi:hypothetical protein